VRLQFSGWTVFLKGKWDLAEFVTRYLPLAMFPVLYLITRFAYKATPIKPIDMDFVTNIAEIEAET
jgi:amino acid transporter